MLLRTTLLLSVCFAAACAGTDALHRLDDEAWSRIQRDRLRALRRSQQADDLVAEARSARSTRQGQDPQRPHVNEIEPPRRRVVRPATAAYNAELGAGVGTLKVRHQGTRLDGDAAVWAIRAAVEPVPGTAGPGLQLELQRSSDELFAGELTNDGQTVIRAAAQASGIDCNPHYVLPLTSTADLDVPLRLGGFVDGLRLQHEGGELRRSWFGFGLRAELAPSWTVWRQRDLQLDLRGLLGGDFGGTRFRENFVGGSDDDTVWRAMGEAGIGARLSTDAFVGDIGWRIRGIDYGATDTSLLGESRRTSLRSSMFFVDAGVRF